MGHFTFDQMLEQWRDNRQSLSQQQRSNVATECSSLLGDQSQTGPKALQHKYRVAAHAVLAADSGLADQVTRVRDTHMPNKHGLLQANYAWDASRWYHQSNIATGITFLIDQEGIAVSADCIDGRLWVCDIGAR